MLPRVKLRLGRTSPHGEQKGVDLRIGLDLAAHGRNHVVDTMYLVRDDDLSEAVEEAQNHGSQVVILAVPDRPAVHTPSRTTSSASPMARARGPGDHRRDGASATAPAGCRRRAVAGGSWRGRPPSRPSSRGGGHLHVSSGEAPGGRPVPRGRSHSCDPRAADRSPSAQAPGRGHHHRQQGGLVEQPGASREPATHPLSGDDRDDRRRVPRRRHRLAGHATDEDRRRVLERAPVHPGATSTGPCSRTCQRASTSTTSPTSCATACVSSSGTRWTSLAADADHHQAVCRWARSSSRVHFRPGTDSVECTSRPAQIVECALRVTFPARTAHSTKEGWCQRRWRQAAAAADQLGQLLDPQHHRGHREAERPVAEAERRGAERGLQERHLDDGHRAGRRMRLPPRASGCSSCARRRWSGRTASSGR